MVGVSLEPEVKEIHTLSNTLKSKTLEPGETLKLTTDSDGIRYTLRQGERKKKGTAKARRGFCRGM